MFLTQPMLMQGGGVTAVSITNQIINSTAAAPSKAEYVLDSNGDALQVTTSGGTVPIAGEWLVSGAAADFEVMATVNSGSLTTGTTGSWESLSVTQSWTKEQAVAGSSTVNFTVQIRRAADGAVLDSADIDMTADAS